MVYTLRNGRKPPLHSGEGVLCYPGFTGEVTYEVMGNPESLRAGGGSLRGSITASTEQAQGAFRAGQGRLRLQDGKEYRVNLIGYTQGSDTVYFDLSR